MNEIKSFGGRKDLSFNKVEAAITFWPVEIAKK